jgi:secernin
MGESLLVCDLLCALPPATGDVALFAKNSDRPPDERQQLEWVPAHREHGPVRTTYAEVPPHSSEVLGVLGSRPAWMWGYEHGVNEAGLAVGNATIFTTLDPRGFPDSLTGMDLVRLALERADSAGAGVEVIDRLLQEIGQGGSGHEHRRRPYWSSFLICDPAEAYLVETSGRELGVERVERSRATSNRTTIPAFDAAHRHPDQAVADLVQPRYDASCRVLADEPVTVERLQRHLASHDGGDDGWTVCMHVELEGIEEATTASIVAELPELGPPVAHVAMGSPCTTPYATIVVGEPLPEEVRR